MAIRIRVFFSFITEFGRLVGLRVQYCINACATVDFDVVPVLWVRFSYLVCSVNDDESS